MPGGGTAWWRQALAPAEALTPATLGTKVREIVDRS
jgi:hypothetical protein